MLRLFSNARPILLCCLLLIGCTGDTDRQVYEVRGVMRGVQYEGAALVVDHEAIPGFMDAMRMTFRMKDPSQIHTLAPGDKIRFDLIVDGDEMHIENVERLPGETLLELAGLPGD